MKHLIITLVLSLCIIFTVSAATEYDDADITVVEIVEVDTVAVSTSASDMMLQSQVYEMRDSLEQLHAKMDRLSDDYAIAHGRELELQRTVESCQAQIDSLYGVNSALDAQIQAMDSLKIYYARKLPYYLTTPRQINLGVKSFESIQNPQWKDKYRDLLPLLKQMNSLNLRTLHVLEQLQEDSRRTDDIYFNDWKLDAEQKLNELKGTIDKKYVRLRQIVDAALAQINAVGGNTPDFSSIIQEFEAIK